PDPLSEFALCRNSPTYGGLMVAAFHRKPDLLASWRLGVRSAKTLTGNVDLSPDRGTGCMGSHAKTPGTPGKGARTRNGYGARPSIGQAQIRGTTCAFTRNEAGWPFGQPARESGVRLSTV